MHSFLLKGPSLPVPDIILSLRFLGYHLGFGFTFKNTLAGSPVLREGAG